MSHSNSFFKRFYESYIPNSRDNLKQIIFKILFIISFIGLVVSTSYIANYFLTAEKEDKVIENTREIWHNVENTENEIIEDIADYEFSEAALKAHNILKKQNSDFTGWLSLPAAGVDNPVYQTKNNSYYLDHNQNKSKSVYGALFFDYNNKITEDETDRNLIIYGHEMKNGSMFGSLKKLRNLSFYKENSTVELTIYGKRSVYRIYSVFVLNASKKDDDGYIYNIYRQNFLDDNDFFSWVSEAKERSIIDTNVEVLPENDILTLITCAGDFNNARLVVMAKKLNNNEDKSPVNNEAHANPDPRYPAKWYTDRGIKREEN